jgi:kynurenine formamidase
MTTYIYLTYPQRSDAPGPPAIPTLEHSPFLTVDKDGANVTMLKLTSHTGTHLDVPRHVFNDGLSLTDLSPSDFIFTHPVIIDLPAEDAHVVSTDDLRPFVSVGAQADLLLFRFGYADIRRMDKARFSTQSPGFGVESAQFLRNYFPRLRGLGMDVPSLSCIAYLDQTFQAHHVLLGGTGRRFIVIEDMNLAHDLSGLEQVIAAPLLVDNLDGSPCTVIAKLK